MKFTIGVPALACGLLLTGFGAPLRADEVPEEYRATIKQGLEWLVKTQAADGHWEAQGGQYPATMTALGGMALLMEGSTARTGKYAPQIRKAVEWFCKRAQPNGLLGDPRNPTEASRYIYGHGYGMLFLSQVYGEEEDGDNRRKLEKILTRAVEFSGNAQTNRGGWGYVSAKDGSNFDEGSTTITQLQGLRAARNSGIRVPPDVIKNAQKYLREATTPQGQILYSLAGGRHPGGHALVVAAIAGGFSLGEYDSKEVKLCLTYCRKSIPIDQHMSRIGHDEYTHYYYAQTMYMLGEDRYKKLFPDLKDEECMTWSKYRKLKFEQLKKSQSPDGSWASGNIGPIFATAVNLAILQLDNGTLPIYQR